VIDRRSQWQQNLPLQRQVCNLNRNIEARKPVLALWRIERQPRIAFLQDEGVVGRIQLALAGQALEFSRDGLHPVLAAATQDRLVGHDIGFYPSSIGHMEEMLRALQRELDGPW
jgi:hypothetical protein